MSQIRDFQQARNYVHALPRGAGVPEVDRRRFPITSALVSYVLDFESAKLKHGLHQFDVQGRLDGVRRVPAEILRPWRSIAGLLILCGLLCTLATLSLAVKPLGDAFRELSQDQQLSGGTPVATRSSTSGNKVSRIQTTMSEMANKARLAFGLSFLFISAAFTVMATVARMHRNRAHLISEFASWAEQAYRSALPEQISIAEAASAFKENAQALGDLTRSFNDLSVSLEAVKNFSVTMEDVREAIVKSLDRMPGEIQASMGLVTKDLVTNLERSMKDEVEAIKKILAIYGQQEFRIDEIGKHVSAVKGLTEQIAGAATTLEAIPKQLSAIDASLKQHTSVAGRIEATAKQIEESVLAFPSEELRRASKALIDATANIGRAHTQAAEAIEDLLRKTAALSKLDSDLGEKVETITTASQQFLGAYNNLMSNFDSGQKLVAESLERVAIQIGREVTRLADKAENATVSTPLKKLGLAFDDFRARLRLVRSPSPNPVAPSSPLDKSSNDPDEYASSGETAASAAAGQSSASQIGTAVSTSPDQVRAPITTDATDSHKSNGENGAAATVKPSPHSNAAPLVSGANQSGAFNAPNRDEGA